MCPKSRNHDSRGNKIWKLCGCFSATGCFCIAVCAVVFMWSSPSIFYEVSQPVSQFLSPFPVHPAELTYLPTGKRRRRDKEETNEGWEGETERKELFCTLLTSTTVPHSFHDHRDTSCVPPCTFRHSSQPNPLFHTSHAPMQPSYILLNPYCPPPLMGLSYS